jgi:hypothetical protein
MYGFIGEIDWVNCEAMKYWSAPSSYTPERKKNEIKSAVFSGQYLGSIKVDGYYQRLVKDEDGNVFMIARNKNVKGEAINKIEWVPQLEDYMSQIPNGTVLLCECYLPNNEGSKNITSLLGCLKEKCIARQNSGQKLHFYIFDICAYKNENLITTPAGDRFNLLNDLAAQYVNEYVEYAKYYRGEELWIMLQDALASGREGMVITREDCPIYFKRTPARMTIKIKKELQETVDVVVMGANEPTMNYTGKNLEDWDYYFNTITNTPIRQNLYKEYVAGAPVIPVTKNYFNNWAGSLKIGVYKDGEFVQIGSLSGLEEEVLANWRNYIGKVAEITAMEIMKDTMGIRHPRFVRFKSEDEKNPKECVWEDIFG